MATSCCLRHSQFFFNTVGTEVTWLGSVGSPASAVSGFLWHFQDNSSAHGEPFLWLQWVWTSPLPFASNKHAHKNVEKRHHG